MDQREFIPLQLAEGITSKRKEITTQFHQDDWERPFVETFGKPYLEYRRCWNQAGPSNIPDFPVHIDFQLTDACNMSCTFCPRDTPVMEAMGATDLLNRGTKMPLAMFKSVIDEGVKYNLRAINLGSTSEPLIHRDVVEMVRYAREQGVIDIRMITNGLLLKEKMIRNLFGAGLTYLGISVDAWNAETYRQVRKNNLTTIIANAELAMNIRAEMGLKFPRIRVSFVNSPEAQSEFPQFLEYWKSRVDWVELQDFDDFGGPVVNRNFTCLEPFRRLMVWASGVVGCIAWTAERYPYGHLHGQTIKDCWDSQALRELRATFTEKHPYNEMCLGCYGKMATKE